MGESENLPQTIGRYEVQRVLGAGAMGSVVLAEDPRIKRKVAIKTVKMDAIRSDADRHEFMARFQREAEVSGLLNHPGIVAIYDVGEEAGLGPFLAMEYVAGKPLDALIKSASPMPIKEKLRIAAGIAEALDHAHAMGVVHRDVKPGNVMVTEDGRPKLMDFGIAKREDASLTQTGTFLGTPSYASPEQIKEGVVDNRSDIFSFGVLVFELMSGASPFPGNSINTILYKIVNEPPVDVRPPVTGILPDGWQRVFNKVLAKKPQERHATCAAFVRDLMEATTEIEKDDRRELLGMLKVAAHTPIPEIISKAFDETTVVPYEAPKGGSKSWMVAVAAVVVLGGGGWFMLRGGSSTAYMVNSNPVGATIFINKDEYGRTPQKHIFKAGDQLRLEKKGFKTIDTEFKAGAMPQDFDMEPIVSPETIDSDPAGASVVLDGRKLEGVTPLKLDWNQGMKHQLSLTKDNLSKAQDFLEGEAPEGRVFKLEESKVAGKMPEPALDPNAPGFLRNAGGFGVRIKVNGQDKGDLAAGGKLSLAPGDYKVDMSNSRYYFKGSSKVTVAAGQPVSIGVPGLATVTVETIPGVGKVFVDGVDTGIESDGSTVQVAHGSHQFTIRGSKGAKTENVDVRGNQTVKIQY